MSNHKKPSGFLKALSKVEPVIWMLGIIFIIFSIMGSNFLTLANAANIIKQASPFLILALAETMAVLVGQIELSVGNNMAFCTVIIALLMRGGVPVPLAITGGVVTGGLCGLLNGVFIARFKVPAYITTFGFGFMFYGIGSLVTGGVSVPALDRGFRFLADGDVLGVPMILIIAMMVFFLVRLLVYRTSFGRNMYGLGGNREALYLGGVDPVKAEVVVFTVVGILVGIAGVLFAARSGSGHPDYGKQWEFNAIAATIIGGNSFSEGNGSIYKTVLGVLFIQILKTGLNLSGVSPQAQPLVLGLIVVAAISIDMAAKARKEA